MYEYIENLVNKANMSVYQLSVAIGVPSQLIYNWKNGKSKPSLDSIKKMSDFFGVPISYFFDGKMTDENDISEDDVLLIRELNKSDKIELIKDIMKIQSEKDLQLIDLLTKKILESQK